MHLVFARRVALILLSFWLVTPSVASWTSLWTIGQEEDSILGSAAAYDEFSPENYANDARPGDVYSTNNPVVDDDFYCAGIFPAGFNNLSTNRPVLVQEPDKGWERALNSTDRTNRVHFFLNASDVSAMSMLRLSFEICDGFSWIGAPVSQNGEGFGQQDIEVRFKGTGASTLVLAKKIDRSTQFTVDFSATNVQAAAGPNTIEFIHAGPNVANTTFWLQFDFVRLEVDTNALADADGDGLPRWWEDDNHLSDANPVDAMSDKDGDGRTAMQEFNGGLNSTDPNNQDTDGDGLKDGAEFAADTNPKLADTDGDSLTDGEEMLGTPTSNPLVADSDGDGAPDAWERRVGTDPMNPASKPTAFAGAIGIHFVSQNDMNGTLSSNDVAGLVPQFRWNETIPLRTWTRTNGSKADIVAPLTNQIVRSDGIVVSNLTFSWKADASDASDNKGSADRKLMSGYVRAYAATPVTLTLSNIPFASYDLYVVVGGSYVGQRGRVRLGTSATTDRFFRTATTAPQATFVEIKPGTNYQSANFVRYTNLTTANALITVSNLDGSSLGIHAVQIVNRTLDADGSGIPDWWEIKNALEPGSTALAATDSDGDGLSNLQEYQRGTDPHMPDTDGDGLSDAAESVANAFTTDSDGDGLSDGDELTAAIPSNPNLADTDGDGVGDKEEVLLGTDPTYNPNTSPSFIGYIPFFRSSPARWEWDLENVQLVWDHGAGALSPNIWNEDYLMMFAIKNATNLDWRTLGMGLRYYNGGLTYLFHSEPWGGFSYAGMPAANIWESDYGNPPTDLKAKLGFSGYGPADISSRLRFRLFAQRGATSNSWIVTFSITNQTSNTLVISRSFTNSTVANAALNNGTATWTDINGVAGQPSFELHQGVRMFITTNALENLPAFANAKDTDNDGMPDVWETANGFNTNLASDATGDADGDGIINRDECLAGTNPRNADTDGDGISDQVERANLSNPLLASSKPEFAGLPWPNGQDLEGNGLPDAWEARYHAFNLAPDGDADGDGASNALEAKWGTDPLDANSVPAIGLARETNDVVVSWPSIEGKVQKLFSGDSLTNWMQFSGVPWLSGDQYLVRFTNRMNQVGSEFYRVSTDDKDSDGDGVKDWDELALGSDPFRSNSTRTNVPIIDSNGVVTGTVSGDFATFIGQFQNASSSVSRVQAARLLQQATFGVTLRDVERVQQLGIAGWIDDQITNAPTTLHRKYIEQIYADFNGPRTDLTYYYDSMNQFISGNNCTTPFARAAIGGPDQLRQRVAFALSQICVASRRDPGLENRPLSVSDFYDIFVRNAFGSYSTVLREVTLHPVMGRYLSHIGNQKARPEINQYPDENYAREVQQLFSIGLWELNQDGTRKLDTYGQPIPTYGNAQITEFARVFTGLWYGGQSWGNGGWTDDDSSVPMQMWADKHDFGAKTLLNGLTIPARPVSAENGMRDVDDALGNLFEHPNTGPFIGKQLIQFLVTSNPSSNYVGRISAVFVNDGTGKRGNLAAVVKAILLDDEARNPRWHAGAPSFGRLKEPVQRAMAVARAGNLARYKNLIWWTWGEFNAAASQEPGYSPSVFNFYRPGYQPPGLLTANGLVGPAFQITDSYTSISFPNKLWEFTTEGLHLWDRYHYPPDYTELVAQAGSGAALVDEANLLFCAGTMSAATRDNILAAINQVPTHDLLLRTQLAVYLAATCPEGAVQR